MPRVFKRPESVLVVIYTNAGKVLMLERRQPPGYWQSVTGSLEWGEPAEAAAIREVREETGLNVQEQLQDCGYSNRFEILPAWRTRYAPDVRWNVEYVFRVVLPEMVPIRVNGKEHVRSEWLSRGEALHRASSHTNRAAIERYVVRGGD